MTVESVLAHGLKTSVFGSQWNAEHGENLALLDPDRIKSDTLANRPAFGVARRFFFATDNQKLYYDTGAAWVEPAPTAMAHAASHTSGGADAVTLAQSQVANLAADLAAKEPANANIQAHIASAANPHAVTKAHVGLGNADNTSDAAKPVSTAAQTALNLKANDNSVPHLTGNESIGGVKTFTDMVKFSRGIQVASAADLRVDTNADGIYFNVTGTTTITSIHTLGATGTGAAKGILPLVMLKFDGALTLTHSASLILPGAVNIITHAGLVLTFVEESAGVWRCIGGDTLFGDYGSQDFTDVSFTPSGTASLENITGAGKEFPFTPKFTGVYELEWSGTVFPITVADEVNLAVDASAGAPTVIRKSVLYLYNSAGDIRRGQNPKTIFSLVAGTVYTFNVQIRNVTATRSVAVGYSGGTSGAGKWFIKRIA